MNTAEILREGQKIQMQRKRMKRIAERCSELVEEYMKEGKEETALEIYRQEILKIPIIERRRIKKVKEKFESDLDNKTTEGDSK